jgi:ABC-type Fe3+-hydroxamate transport system substrate-binding protein
MTRQRRTALTPFFHPILIQDRIQRGEDTDADLREQIRFIGKALGKSAARSD